MTVANDPTAALMNRIEIEANLRGGTVVQLPAGAVHLDRSLLLGPEHSGGTLTGKGPATRLVNSGSAGNAINSTVTVAGTGINYFQLATAQGDDYILDDIIPGTPLPWDHWSAETSVLVPGSVVYAFHFNSYLSVSLPPRKRYVIVRFDRATRRLTLDQPADPALPHLKWMAGHPIADVTEGARIVTLPTPAHAADYPAGRSVFVTSGPSVANEACGEHRRVLAADPATGVVTLDRAVTRSYTTAALALVNPVTDLTISRLTIGVPLETRAPPLFAKFCTNLRLIRVTADEPNSAGLSIANCGPMGWTDCEVNNLVLNCVHDTAVEGGVYSQVYGEEACTSTTLRNLTVRANVAQPNTGVLWHNGSDRLRLERVRLEGFGTVVPGSGTSNAFNLQGRGLSLTDVDVQMLPGVMAGYVQGDGSTLRRLVSNTGLTVYAGRGWWLQDCTAPGWDLRAGTSGTATGCVGLPPGGPGWTIMP